MTVHLDKETENKIAAWKNYDAATKEAIDTLFQENPKELIDAFYTNLSFGTGGLRGLMGVGTNRMNNYTVAFATQGLANYLKQAADKRPLSVFIGYDSRLNSQQFAEEAALILAGNNIKTFLCQNIRPTPFVSFGCRQKECSAAIMITASHNPKEYNGYKAYWNDGAQVLPPHDIGIIHEVEQIINPIQVKKAASLNDPLIEYVGDELDIDYLEAIKTLLLFKEEDQKHGKDLHIIYTSLHGTGITLLPEALKNSGFTHVSYVEEQCIPDGNFPTVKSPNPEEKAALELGIQLLEKENADILIANDPDADRVGVAVYHHGKTIILNGNQIAALLIHFIFEILGIKDQIPKNATFVKTIVTTELLKKIAHAHGKECIDVLTGFKYIAEKIREWENIPNGPQYIFGGEESYGYLFGTLVRDKDAISTSVLIAESALHAKLSNKTLIDQLHDIYKKYGCFVENVISVTFDETKAGKEKMQQGMQKLQENPPKEIGGIPVVTLENYSTSLTFNMLKNTQEKITLPKSDVLIFWLQDGSKLIVRPSGTEPKIKIYGGVVIEEFDSVDSALELGQKKVATLTNSLKALFYV